MLEKIQRHGKGDKLTLIKLAMIRIHRQANNLKQNVWFTLSKSPKESNGLHMYCYQVMVFP